MIAVLLWVAACTPAPRGAFVIAGAGAPAVAGAPPAPAGQNITVTELARGAHSSVAAVQVRDREVPHRHARYDLTVYVTDGHGTLWLDGVPRPMRAGDAAFIPRGTPHYFVNEGAAPALAIVVFSPAFDGPDQEPLPPDP
jgi:quercetin dioxygenase-like cupin family protein